MKRTALVIAIGALCTGLSAGALAQENGQDQQGQQNQTDQQGQMNQQEGQDQQDSMSQQEPSGDQQQGGQQNELMSMPASELEGMTVVNQEDEELGDVGRIAVSTQDNQVYAIISVGGFLGMGDKSVALPVQDMELQEDQLLLKTSRSEDELKQSAEDYNEEDYQTVEGDTTLSDAAGGSGGGSGSTGGGSTGGTGGSAGDAPTEDGSSS